MNEQQIIEFQKMKDDIANTSATTLRIEKKLDEYIKSSDKKFAGKWVEKVLCWAGMTVGGIMVLYVLKIIFSHNVAL